jgi:hypothetical protein
VSIDISNIKEGDRVRLTAANGNEATFTVTAVRHNALEGTNLYYAADGWDTIEVVNPPLPDSKPGLFLFSSYGLDDDGQLSQFPDIVMRNRHGEWYAMGNVNGTPRHLDKSKIDTSRLVRLTLEAKP